MVAISDRFGKASITTDYAQATTVKVARSTGESVLSAFDLSKFATDTPVFFVTYKKTTDPETGDTLITNQRSWKALVNADNNTLTNLELAPGYTDINLEVGDFIEPIPTSFWANELIAGLLTSLNPDGTLKAIIDNPGWTPMPDVPVVTAQNGKRSTSISIPGDYTGVLSKGMKLRLPRVGTVPTRSADFNGSSQYGVKTSPTGVSQTDDITVEGILHLDDAGSGTERYILNRRASSSTGWRVTIQPDGTLEMIGYNGSYKRWFSAVPFPTGRDVHFAVSMDLSATSCKMYFDGEDVGTTYTNTGSVTSISAGGNLALGTLAYSAGGSLFDGRMSELRYWSVVRTQTEIRNNMYQQVASNESNLVGYWKLDGDLNDSTSNANHFTPSGGLVATFANHLFKAVEHANIRTNPVFSGGNTTMDVNSGLSSVVPNGVLDVSSYSAADQPFGCPEDVAKGQIDTGWQRILFNSPFVNGNPGEAVVARRIGRMVYTNGNIGNTGMAANGSYDIGVMPYRCNPNGGITPTYINQTGGSNGNSSAFLRILTSGTVTLRLGSSLAGYYWFGMIPMIADGDSEM